MLWIIGAVGLARVTDGWLGVSYQLWLNLWVPIAITLGLVHESSQFRTIVLMLSLATYYLWDLNTVKSHSSSITFHHWLCVALCGWACVTTLWCVYLDPEALPTHITTVRLVMMSEVSTIFLNLRPVLRAVEAYKTHTYCTYAFMITFLVCRFGPSWWILAYYPFVVPKCGYIVFLGLNIYWAGRFVSNRLIPGAVQIEC